VNEITERLKQIIADDLDIDVRLESIRDDMGLMEDGIGLDSVALMEFISIVEDEFGFAFSDDELGMAPFESLRVLSEFVAAKIAVTTA